MKKLLKRKREIIPIGLIVLMLAIGAYFYPVMPDRMPIHWNAAGQIDNYGSKMTALFIIPIIVLVVYIFLSAIPALEVHRENISGFRHFYGIKVSIVLFMFALYAATITQALGYTFDMGRLTIVLVAILFYYIGYAIRDVKKNYFIGIRTPWTLSSEKVWAETHRAGSFFFRLMALVMLAGFFFDGYRIYFVLVPVIALLLFSLLYSFYLFKQEQKGKKKKKGKNVKRK